MTNRTHNPGTYIVVSNIFSSSVADAKNEAEAAKEKEVALWQEALETGQKVHPLTEEILNKHAQGPIIIEDERNNSGNQEVSLTAQAC